MFGTPDETLALVFDIILHSLNYHFNKFTIQREMCMMCAILSLSAAVIISEYSSTRDTLLPSCLLVLSEHVPSQSEGQSADLDLLKLVKKRKVWPALFRGNLCI